MISEGDEEAPTGESVVWWPCTLRRVAANQAGDADADADAEAALDADAAGTTEVTVGGGAAGSSAGAAWELHYDAKEDIGFAPVWPGPVGLPRARVPLNSRNEGLKRVE